jgi:glycosyltransferase involved in cell wall biosynthesis
MVTICLSMIVRNESAIIRRLLDSVLPLIDSYCICDTGSTDDTVALIEKHLAHLPGKLLHCPFQDFAFNRNVALKPAREMADYVLLLDADMVLAVGAAFDKAALTADAYQFQQGSDAFRYLNTRMVKSSFESKYYGVTHEYIDLGGGNPKFMPHLKINDHGDGGSKTNKFVRDSALLVKGIQEEPDNARYHFYLGNTYHDREMYEEAIEMYKKRVVFGGFQEEVFYAMYRMSLCYKALKDEANFVGAAVSAWKYRPSRIESIFELVRYYKEQQQHKLASVFYRLVAGTPLSSDGLFVHANMYEYELDYEYSLSAFFVGEKNVCQVYRNLFNQPKLNLQCQISNYKFYVPSLESVSYDFTCRYEIDLDGCLRPFHSSTPCITATETGYLVNLRLVDYVLNNHKYTHFKNGTTSINKYLVLDRDFQILEEAYFDAEERQGEGFRAAGVDDLRVFGDKFCGTVQRADGCFRVGVGVYANPLQYNILKVEGETQREKNWVFVDADTMVYKWQPLSYGALVGDELVLKPGRPMPRLFDLARGSTCAAKFKGELWFTVHFVDWPDYYHGVVVLSPNMELVRYTLPFKFGKGKIEFCCGMVVEEERVLFGVSQNDATSQVFAVRHMDLEPLFIHSTPCS